MVEKVLLASPRGYCAGVERAVETVERALEMISNTAPFDISHHPAMAVPCGMSHGLPVSMMLIGKHWDEPTIYRAAAAFEGGGDWKKM